MQSIAERVAQVRATAEGNRYIANEWSRLAPDDITALGFGLISKETCSLLRSNADLLDSLAQLIEGMDKDVGRNSQRDH